MLAERLRRELGAKQVVGCDFSHGMLRRGAARDPGVGWVQADALRLPFADASIAALVSTEAFHWFPDQPAALAEFRRVLEPRGKLLLALIHPRLELASQLTRAGSRWLGEPLHWPARERLRGWLAEAGFRVEAQRRIFRVGTLLLFPTYLTVASRDG
jgi:ubiquinone/menaquinone biosynthesis C-methylase UbiE